MLFQRLFNESEKEGLFPGRRIIEYGFAGIILSESGNFRVNIQICTDKQGTDLIHAFLVKEFKDINDAIQHLETHYPKLDKRKRA